MTSLTRISLSLAGLSFLTPNSKKKERSYGGVGTISTQNAMGKGFVSKNCEFVLFSKKKIFWFAKARTM